MEESAEGEREAQMWGERDALRGDFTGFFVTVEPVCRRSALALTALAFGEANLGADAAESDIGALLVLEFPHADI